MNTYRSQKGITLIEMMIAIVVLAILVTIGIPSFNTLIQNNRATAIANELVSATHLARSEAVRRGQAVTICPSQNQSSCQNVDWSQGWIVVTQASGQVIRVWEAQPQQASFQHRVGNNLLGQNANKNITFERLGNISSGDRVRLEVSVSGSAVNQERCLEISVAGRVNVRRGGC